MLLRQGHILHTRLRFVRTVYRTYYVVVENIQLEAVARAQMP